MEDSSRPQRQIEEQFPCDLDQARKFATDRARQSKHCLQERSWSFGGTARSNGSALRIAVPTGEILLPSIFIHTLILRVVECSIFFFFINVWNVFLQHHLTYKEALDRQFSEKRRTLWLSVVLKNGHLHIWNDGWKVHLSFCCRQVPLSEGRINETDGHLMCG